MERSRACVLLTSFLLTVAGCEGSDRLDGPGNSGTATPALDLVATGLSSVVYLTAAPGDTARLFVVEQTGRIRIIRHDTLLSTPFLDIADSVTAGGERGLLSMAFHPRYAENGFFFVDYTDTDGDTRVVRYQVSADPQVADPQTATTVLVQNQPFANHNGGLVAFGPDGFLYVGLGDGGSGGDPQGHGQNLETLLGSILRIDVDGAAPYVVPRDNPFAGRQDARGEIWVHGLRNPWRFSFDRASGDLYIADVGQRAREEVNVQPASSGGGENYGWNVMEGTTCFDAATCDQTGLTLPVLDYTHADGCSVTGGYVYRGSVLPSLTGHYFYADYCAGWVRSLRYQGGAATDRRDWTGTLNPGPNVTSFGEDARGELYILTQGGQVFRIVPAEE